ncbi:MAG: protoporphyrinogen/coproporphyrinogen oxidase, partial [Candidatus Nanoarchaeia archaeon]
EKEPKPGGRMATKEIKKHIVDTGANSFIQSYSETLSYCQKLGVGLVDAPGASSIYRDGKRHQIGQNITSIARFSGLSLKARGRMALFALKHSFTKLSIYDLNIGKDVDIDADTFMRKLSPELADYLMDPLLRTFHFHSAKKLSMKFMYALARTMATTSFQCVVAKDHMHALPKAFAKHLNIEYGAPVSQVESKKKVTISFLDKKEMFDAAIIATPAHIAKQILQKPTKEQSDMLSVVKYAPTITCTFDCPEDFKGAWVPFKESQIIASAANDTYKGGGNVSTVFLHEEAIPNLIKQTDEEILEFVGKEMVKLFKSKVKGLNVKRWSHAIPLYSVNSVTTIKQFWPFQGKNNIYFTGDYLNHPWVEGSIQCAQKVAKLFHSKTL